MTTFINGRFDILNGKLFFNKSLASPTFNEVSKCNLKVANGKATLTFEYAKNCNDSFALDFGENAKLAAKIYEFFNDYLAAEWWERKNRWAFGISAEGAQILLNEEKGD